MKSYFKPVKTGKHLGELEDELTSIPFNNIESCEDRKGNPMVRLFNGKMQVGVVVLMNRNLVINATKIIEETMVWNRKIC